ncbi:MAG TPA: trypsin-like peptidase domain-containing protein [Vicinamibacterales bacterium]|nr:trypsin-like peptidase domain-containing protein [Vicinamibacterales bacterium]
MALGALLTAASVWTAPALSQRAASTAAAPRPVVSRPPLGADERATIELFERARESVVYITTQTRVIDPWTRNIFSIPRGTGSGFLWDERGHIVTNYHVVSGASGARIRMSDGRDVSASLVGVSAAHDLAVLRVAVNNPPRPLPIGTSHDLQVGQKTFAIGNPFGLDWTLTTGIISALDRSLPTEDGRGLIQHLIQTDAAINPGNSGGPLLDSAGRLIGVNTAIYSPSGASAGVGFAVPVDTVNRVVPQLIARGKYVRPALGIEVDEDLNRLVSARLGVTGVAVLRVRPGSGAAAAGLRGIRTLADGSVEPGDIIVAIDGQPVDSVARLLGRLDDHAVGDTVRVTVVRSNTRREVTVRLQAGSE